MALCVTGNNLPRGPCGEFSICPQAGGSQELQATAPSQQEVQIRSQVHCQADKVGPLAKGTVTQAGPLWDCCFL